MCAIAGILNLKYNSKIIRILQNTMRHRGPDEEGVFQDNDCCLMHNRLTIIDPDGGKQPMSFMWAGEWYTIVYNGELYNTFEIRRELEKLGHIFAGHSDTEVVLHAYAQWGESSLKKLNGIFGFAVWEEKKKRLFLARDRMGVKPLFYSLHNGGILFASEIKTILSYPSMKSKLDAEGVAQIILLGPGRVPGSGVFRDIYELEPGCFAVYEAKHFYIKQYWKLTDREHTDNFEETAQKVRYLVVDAIRRQMVSDMPLGTFLSGGLDSSLISSVCAWEYKKQGKKLQTFSVDYENNDKYFLPGKFQPDSDNHYINTMRKYLDCEHNWTVLTPEQLVAFLEDATYARDLPGMADVDFSLLLFCGDIRKKVKVSLSGECADEIFGGYPWYRDPEVRALDGFPWAQNTKQRIHYLHPYYRGQIDGEAFVNDHYQKTCNQTDILPGTSKEETRMKQMVNLNYRWFMQTLLDRKDRMSMYQGLEVRVPFCDYRIAEYLYGVPWEFKDYEGREKGLLRYAMRDYLPEEVLYRKKSPYPKTYDPKYLELVSEQLKILLSSKNEPIFDVVNVEALEGLLNADYTWPWYGQLMKVPQTIAYMLQINTWLKNYHIELI